jgi:N-acetylglucosaminyldiphosphoundecaprenol N-acetyl-beta-D-mannosaminyltransferase
MREKLLSVPFLSYSVFSGSVKDIGDKDKILVNTINQYSYCIAEKDSEFKEALQRSDILLPDGIAIVAAIKFLSGKNIKKIAGADIHRHLLQELNQKNGSCFYLGSSENTLSKIRKKISREFPQIKFHFFSPPYKQEFSEEENKQMIDAVNASRSDVLFIGMTAPKQEKWAHTHKKQLDAKIICSIGAVFDFYAGTIERPHQLWIKLGLEWLIRLVREPKRMWKRYLYYGPIFIYDILKKKLNTT